MTLFARVVIAALFASTLVALQGSPASAAQRCVTNTDLPTQNIRSCEGWGKVYKGASLTKPRSSYAYAKGSKDAVNLYLSFRLADIRADGRCAWVRAVKVGVPSYDEYQPDPVCGKGNAANRLLEFKDRNVTPGRFRLLLCGGQGKGRCVTVFRQRFR